MCIEVIVKIVEAHEMTEEENIKRKKETVGQNL